MKSAIAFVSVCLLAGVSFAGTDKKAHTPPVAPKEFEQLKGMIGTWEATTKNHETGKEETSTVNYELTSGGSTIIEKIFVGTPHEMVSVYSNDGKKVSMTHYCMMGNQPQMALKNAKDNTLTFAMNGTNGIKGKNDPHMHGLVMTITDKDHARQEWAFFEKGKQASTTVIELARK